MDLEKLHHLIDEALKEDVGDGDHSTLSCIDKNARGKAVLKIKQDGVLAGVEVAEKIFLYSNSQLQTAISLYKKYGFEHVPVTGAPFLTADVKMELSL